MAITISVTAGTGYAGSTYTQTGGVGAGQWYAGNAAIAGATGNTYVMTAANEGKAITYRTASEISNIIQYFVPPQMRGCIADFDAWRNDLMSISAGAIASWASKNGAWTATQAASTKPTWSATGRNSRPAVTGDGVGQFLDLNPSGNPLPTSGPCHLFAVGYSAGASANYRMLVKWGSVSTARRAIAKSNSNVVAQIGGTATTNMQSAESWPGVDRIVAANFRADGGATLVIDGQFETTTDNVYGTPDDAARYIFRDASSYWNGSAQEIIFFNRELSNAERQKVEGYIASKWGLRGLLPSGHPYKSVNPPPEGFVATGTLGALVSVGAYGQPIPLVGNVELGALVGSSTLVQATFAAVDAELGALVGSGGLTSFKSAVADIVLGGLEAEIPIYSELSVSIEGLLGELIAEGAYESIETLDATITLGALVAEGEIIVPSPALFDIELAGLVGEGEFASFDAPVVDAYLEPLEGTGTLTASAGVELVTDVVLGGLVGEIILFENSLSFLVVEDGTIVPNAESYISDTYLRTYALKRGITVFDAMSFGEIKPHIIKAMDYLERLRDKYRGTTTSEWQYLSFPRQNVFLDGLLLDSHTIPERLKEAQALLAIYSAQGIVLEPVYAGGTTQFVTRQKLGPIEREFSEAAFMGMSRLPTLGTVNANLASLMRTGGMLSVSRA